MKFWIISLFFLVVGSAIWFGYALDDVFYIIFADIALDQEERMNWLFSENLGLSETIQFVLSLGFLIYCSLRFRTVIKYMFKRQNSASNKPNPTVVE